MEFLYLLLAAFVFFIVKGLIDKHRNAIKLHQRIEREYGTFNEEDDFNILYGEDAKVFFAEERARHDRFVIDDITANDLDLDLIYLMTDKTGSAAGSVCYYNMLRTPTFDESELKKREDIISYFSENKEKRVNTQMTFTNMSKSHGFHLYFILEQFKSTLDANAFSQYLNIFLLVVAVIFAVINNTPGSLLFPIGVIIYNITTYYMAKSKTDSYIYAIRNIISIINAGHRLVDADIPVLKEENEKLNKLLPKLRPVKKASWAIRETVSMDIGSILLDYANLIFHFDLISLNNAAKSAAKETDTIIDLYKTVGYIDALICVSSMRASSKKWCVPELTKEGKPHVSFKGAYHFLLNDPVTSDLDTENHVLITGSNASGKSTFLKTVALNAIFSQTIHTCFAENYSGSFFKTLTGMSLSDDIVSGESYYITEIKALKRIMDEGGEYPVLCFVDEVLRGTNTVERIAASTSSLKYLADQNKLVFAATHDIELTTLLKDIYLNYHFEESLDEDGDVYFDYVLKTGPSKTRNAILMLKTYGYDERIIKNATALAEEFVASGTWNNPSEAKG